MDDRVSAGSPVGIETQAAVAALRKLRVDVTADVLTFNRRKKQLAAIEADVATIQSVIDRVLRVLERRDSRGEELPA